MMCNLHITVPIGRSIGKFERGLMLNALQSGAVHNTNAWGVFSNRKFYKELGAKVSGDKLKRFNKHSFMVGHNRLSTSGTEHLKNAHPIVFGNLYLSHNGIVSALAKPPRSDTNMLTITLSENYRKEKDPVKALKMTLEKHSEGSYSLAAYFGDCNRLFYYKNADTHFEFGLLKSGSKRTIIGSTYLSNFQRTHEELGFSRDYFPAKMAMRLTPEPECIYEITAKGLEIVEEVAIPAKKWQNAYYSSALTKTVPITDENDYSASEKAFYDNPRNSLAYYDGYRD